jgi:hypothetical protein
VSWVVHGFAEDGDALVNEIHLDEVLREIFRSAVGAPHGDPMLDSYPLSEDALAKLEELFGIALPRAGVAYFLDYYR